MVLAVNWPPQAPAEGQATRSRMSSAASAEVAALVPADRLEHVLHGEVAVGEVAGTAGRRGGRAGSSRHR